MAQACKRILIVDDNESIHNDFKKVLRNNTNSLRDLEDEIFGGSEDEGDQDEGPEITYEIDDAFQGEEAVHMVERAEKEGRPYSVIFMDVRMPPGIDGIEAIAEIWKRFPDKELVLCTAYSDYSWSKMLSKIGLTDKLQFIRKPFDMVSVQQLALSLSKKWDLNQQGKMYIQQLEKENHEKEKAKEELRRLNADLEKRIEARTAEIKQTNEELKSTLEQLKATQDILVANEKMASLGGLVAGIAHEINTPVGIGVTAASHLSEAARELAGAYRDNAMKRSDLENFIQTCHDSSAMIMSNLNRASELIQSFKQVAVDQSSEAKRQFKVKEYINEILISLRPKLKKTDIQVEVLCDDDVILNSLPGAFGQIVSNFVMNSLIHGYDKGTSGHIKIDIKKQKNDILFTYSDDGKGISKENLAKIFDPFFTTRRGLGGSGLGLHIVYNIATQNLGGTINCQSEQGVGTTFVLKIPYEAPDGGIHAK